MVYQVKNKADFDGQLKAAGDLLVLVDFYATWCGPCKMIAPALVQMAKTHEGKLVVLKVDVDECEDLTEEYNITSMPTFVFIKNGAQLESFSGASTEKLEKAIAKHIA